MIKHLKLVIILILLIICIVVFYIYRVVTPYEKDYFGKLGLADVYKYNDLVKVKGIPGHEDIVQQYGETIRELKYDRYEFRLVDNILLSIKITDPNYKLGYKKIGIGSTVKEVKKAYEYVRPIVDVRCGYIEGTTWVEFGFDANSKVNLITISRNP